MSRWVYSKTLYSSNGASFRFNRKVKARKRRAMTRWWKRCCKERGIIAYFS